MKTISQKTIVETKRFLELLTINFSDALYERDFPAWFVMRVQHLHFHWMSVFVALREGGFFFVDSFGGPPDCIIPNRYLREQEAKQLGEFFLKKLVAMAASLPSKLPEKEALLRSLKLDGFAIDEEKLLLMPLDGPVSEREEEERLTVIVRQSGLPNKDAILKHIEDAQSLYSDAKDHPSLNESRSFIQALIDGISIESDRSGAHSKGLPGGTANRIVYLREIGFFTEDEKAAFGSAWGTLSAGSHPGVPDNEQARIGLILALEFGQILLFKFLNWKANAYLKFS
jgi:hypothetical protein